MNRWGIPAGLEDAVIARDLCCAYCGTEFVDGASPRGRKAYWEHIVNDMTIVSPDHIVRCCISCNASKGAKPLELWLKSNYCVSRGIGSGSVSPVVRAHLTRSAMASDSSDDSLTSKAGKRAASGSRGSCKVLVK